MPRTLRLRRLALTLVALATTGLAGCRQDMHNQPRYKPYAESDFFADGVSERQPVEGTVARSELREDPVLYRGMDASGQGFSRTYPMPVTAEVLTRGRERFDIFCGPCHDRTGAGHGMIVRRGFKQPPSFHNERLRGERPGYFFDVMTNGFGQMSPYASQVSVADRWAIAAYIRALQLSQYAPVATLSDADRAALASAPELANADATAAPSPGPERQMPEPGVAPPPEHGEAGAPQSPIPPRGVDLPATPVNPDPVNPR